jgi:hypothetical protein
MRLIASVFLALLAPALLAADCLNPALRDEILGMVTVDQKARPQPGHMMSEADSIEMLRVDRIHAKRVREIISAFGWPGRSLVGSDGAQGVWLLVQHFEISDQDEYLPMMEAAVKKGEAEGKYYAYLLDRVRVRHGQKQLYGTQYQINAAGEWVREVIEDPPHLDERRKAVGMLPLNEFEKTIPNVKIVPHAPPDPTPPVTQVSPPG